jgi:hypothetical protein
MIIEAHGAAEIPIVQSAHIGNLIAGLRDRIAEAS